MSSVPAAAAAGPAASPHSHPLRPRILGVLRQPRATLQTAAASSRWVGLLACLTLVTAGAGALLFETEVGRRALVDEWERTALAFGVEVDDQRYAELRDLSDNGAWYAAARALVAGPVLTLAVAAAVYAIFGIGRGRVPFRSVLSVVVHANVILALRQVVAAPVAYARESTASATSIGAWFSTFDEASPIARVLGVLDLFVLWWLVVLAVGVSVLYGKRARPLAMGFIGIYAALALAMAGVMAVLGG